MRHVSGCFYDIASVAKCPTLKSKWNKIQTRWKAAFHFGELQCIHGCAGKQVCDVNRRVVSVSFSGFSELRMILKCAKYQSYSV